MIRMKGFINRLYVFCLFVYILLICVWVFARCMFFKTLSCEALESLKSVPTLPLKRFQCSSD